MDLKKNQNKYLGLQIINPWGDKMNYTIDDVGLKVIGEEFSINDNDIYKNQNKLKSALILELEMLTNNFIEAFDDLRYALTKDDESKIWYSLSMLTYTRKHIWQLLELIKTLFENEVDDTEIVELEYLLEEYSDIDTDEDELEGNFGKELKKWLENTDKNPILENNIFEKKSLPDLDVNQMIRHFDPDTYELTIFEETIDLKRFHGIVKDIKKDIDEIYRENYLAF